MRRESYLWENNYPEKIQWDAVPWTGPVYAYLEQARRKFPHRPAFTSFGKTWSWGEIGTLSDRMARGLHDLGVEKGVRVGLCLPNTVHYLISYYAVAKTGATIVNFNPLYAERELAHQIEDSGTDLMITFDLKVTYDKMEKMLHATRLNQIVICPFAETLPFGKGLLFRLVKGAEIAAIPNDDRHILFSRVIDNAGDFVPPPIDAENDVALLQYTGGTTGIPKGAMLTHANLTANVEQCVGWFPDIHPGQEKMVAVIPFFHVFAMTAVLNFSVKCGFEIVALPKFDLAETLKLIDREKPHFFPAVPAIYNAINNHPDLKNYDLTSLRYCISGGAPLPVEVKKTFEENSGCVLIEGYGLTEASPVLCANPADGINKPGSIGLPLPGTVIELRDPETGIAVSLGARGELCAKGPQVMKGYWKKPEETAKVLQGGFLRTGDVAFMDEDGYVHIVDRIKDLILVNGYNVYPRMVEEAIYLHPSVEECIVAGLPDGDRGEIPKAWIKLKEGHFTTENDIREFLKDKISPIEMPRRIEFRDQPLPKTMIGKLSKKDVLAQESS
jgi:long-chain acyl-CoA synthetase